jgi:hypothetical protein
MRAREFAALVGLGEPERMMTLTSRRHPSIDRDEATDHLMRSYHSLVKWIRRHYGKYGFEYLWVLELTEEDWPHLHIVFRGDFIPQRLLSKWWERLHGAPIVDIRKVWTGAGAGRYMAKYLGKDLTRIGKHRRYGKSGSWLPKLPKEEPKLRVFGEPRWHRIEGGALEFKHQLIVQRWFPEVVASRHTRFHRCGHWPARAGPSPCSS